MGWDYWIGEIVHRATKVEWIAFKHGTEGLFVVCKLQGSEGDEPRMVPCVESVDLALRYLADVLLPGVEAQHV